MPPKGSKRKSNDSDESNAKTRKINAPVNVIEAHRVTILSHCRDHIDNLFLKELTPAYTKSMYNNEWYKVYEMFKK